MTEGFYPPCHVAIIMDGNGRWARRRGLPRHLGHKAGVNNIRPVVKLFTDYGIKYLTLYLFSTENWNRPKEEVNGLFNFLAQRIKSETEYFHQANIRIKHFGRLSKLPAELRQKVENAVKLTMNNTGAVFCIALDYGGRSEIIEAIHRIIADNTPPANIDEALFNRYLYSEGIPDPDLIIRTGGEMRLSNFLLWQAAYSELYFTPVLWPDFGKKEIDEALLDYKQRQRRFGSL